MPCSGCSAFHGGNHSEKKMRIRIIKTTYSEVIKLTKHSKIFKNMYWLCAFASVNSKYISRNQ